MSAAGTVHLKVDVDTTDALRKLREARREAHRFRRSLRTGAPRWVFAAALALDLPGIAIGIVGLFRHDTFDVAVGALFLCMANRR